jgi:hypothetical protein
MNSWKALLFNDEVSYFANANDNRPSPRPAQYMCVNPLDTYDHERQLSFPRRADVNVVRYNNFLYEDDSSSYDEQLARLERLKLSSLPPTLATFSGGKSIHLIYSLAEPLALEPHKPASIEAYKSVWKRLLLGILETLDMPESASPFDPACKNPSRLTRTPDFVKPESGARQSLLYVGSLLPPAALTTLPELAQRSSNAVFSGWHPWTQDAFAKFALARPWGQSLSSAWMWAAPSGLYDTMFRLILWGIDETGASPDIFSSFLAQHTYPHLRRAGYPEEKFDKPLRHAYHKKTSEGGQQP